MFTTLRPRDYRIHRAFYCEATDTRIDPVIRAELFMTSLRKREKEITILLKESDRETGMRYLEIIGNMKTVLRWYITGETNEEFKQIFGRLFDTVRRIKSC